MKNEVRDAWVWPLTDRDLHLIEVALESAVSSVSSSAHPDMRYLAREYALALAHVQLLRNPDA